MRTAQAGIFALGTASHAYLEFDLHSDTGAAGLVRVVADLREPRSTTGGVNVESGSGRRCGGR
jgi:putative iron-dependent peroxidase